MNATPSYRCCACTASRPMSGLLVLREHRSGRTRFVCRPSLFFGECFRRVTRAAAEEAVEQADAVLRLPVTVAAMIQRRHDARTESRS